MLLGVWLVRPYLLIACRILTVCVYHMDPHGFGDPPVVEPAAISYYGTPSTERRAA